MDVLDGLLFIYRRLWYICRKHVSFVEFVAVMTINASYPLNAPACLGFPELKTLRAIIGSFLARYFGPNVQKRIIRQLLDWNPSCWYDRLVITTSSLMFPGFNGPWVFSVTGLHCNIKACRVLDYLPSLKYDRQLSLALLLLKKTGVKADNLQHCLLYFFALPKSAFNSNGFYDKFANSSVSNELVLQLNLIRSLST